jgi:hypothetical protein
LTHSRNRALLLNQLVGDGSRNAENRARSGSISVDHRKRCDDAGISASRLKVPLKEPYRTRFAACVKWITYGEIGCGT